MTKELEKSIKPLAIKAVALQIETAVQMNEAVSHLSQLNKALDKIHTEKEKVTKPLNEALKAERGRWKPYETSLEEAIEALREKISDYQTQATRLAREEEEKIASRIKTGKGNLSLETAVKKIEEIERPDGAVNTEEGTVKFRTTFELLITDTKLVPPHYFIIDEKKLFEDLKKGVKVYGAELKEKQIPINYR